MQQKLSPPLGVSHGGNSSNIFAISFFLPNILQSHWHNKSTSKFVICLFVECSSVGAYDSYRNRACRGAAQSASSREKQDKKNIYRILPPLLQRGSSTQQRRPLHIARIHRGNGGIFEAFNHLTLKQNKNQPRTQGQRLLSRHNIAHTVRTKHRHYTRTYRYILRRTG